MTKLDERIKKAPEDTEHKGWVNKLSPDFTWGYLQLMRADRPIGTWLLLWPCLWSIVLASHYYGDSTTIANIPLMILFGIGAFVMRGAGCVVNDLWDREADAQVDRTKGRPLPSGRVSVFGALVFLGVLSFIGLSILLQLNSFTIFVGLCSLVLIVIYPLMKRVTYWPQLMLGFTFNWGALMGWAAVSEEIQLPAVILYTAGIFWTLGYDTIYAHQDKEDDVMVGVKSTAIRFGEKTLQWLACFYFLCFALILISGYLTSLNEWFYAAMTCAGIHFIWQLKSLDIDDREICLKLFKSNHHFGALVFISMLIGHL
jgi:4-hydroxybenzoate polyprenyltransferase